MASNAVSARSGVFDLAYLLGRIGLALVFLWSGFDKFANAAGTAGFMQSAGIPAADVLVWLVALVEVAGAVALIVGYKLRWAALALIAFTIVATLVFHAFWAVPAEQVLMQQINFMKNVGIIGGLLAVFAHGAGRYAIDRA